MPNIFFQNLFYSAKLLLKFFYTNGTRTDQKRSPAVFFDKRDYWSSLPEVFSKKVILKAFAKFSGKQLCHWHRCFLKQEFSALMFSCKFCESTYQNKSLQDLIYAFYGKDTHIKNFFESCTLALSCTSSNMYFIDHRLISDKVIKN